MTRKDVVCLAVLAALVALLFFPILLFGETLYFRDVTFNHLPRKQISAEMLRDGVVPLWNPRWNFGEPLLANPNNVAVHPSNLLFLVLPFFAAFNGAVLLEFTFAAAALFVLLRRLGVRPEAAMVAASGYLLSGPVLSLDNFWNGLASAAPAPLALLAAHESSRPGAVRAPILLGAVWALQSTGGEPVLTLATVLLSGGWVLALVEGGSWRGRLASGSRVLARALGWAAGLGALLWLPALELVAGTGRSRGLALDEVTAWSLHPATLLEIVAPGLFGDPTLPVVPYYWGSGFQHRGMPYILSLGVANVTLLAAAFAATDRTRRTRFLALASLVFLVLALGRYTPLFPVLARVVPGATLFRFPVKLFFAANLCLSVLCGLGLERLWGAGVPSGTLRRIAGITAAAVLGVLLFALGIVDPPEPVSVVGPLALSALALAGALIVLARTSPGSRGVVRVAAILVGLILLELWPAHHGLNPTAATEVIGQMPPAAKFLRRDDGRFRIHRRPTPPDLRFRPGEMSALRSNALHRETLSPNAGASFGLNYGLNTTSDDLDWSAARLLGSYAESLPWDDRLRIFGVANVKYVLSFDPIESARVELLTRIPTLATRPLRVYRNLNNLPRAFVAGEARRVDDPREACIALGDRDLDPRGVVVLSGADPGPGGATARSTCRFEAYEPNRIVLDVEADGDGWVVLLDAHAPGWRATVDGNPVEIARANVCFRAVPVTEGTHRVEFRYRPRSVAIGLAVTLAGLVLAGVRMVFPRRRPLGKS